MPCLRGVAAVAACAAVLLTSFDDEVVSALEAAAGPPADVASTVSSDGEGRFPDLARAGGNGPAPLDLPRASIPTVPSATSGRIAAGGTVDPAAGWRPVRALLCVWRI